jgi:methionine-rich copper-binding protein CopC
MPGYQRYPFGLANMCMMRRLLLGLAVTLALIGVPAAADAHAILLDSTPAPNGSLAVGHIMVRMRFNSRIDAARSRVTLTLPDQTKTLLPTDLGPTPDVLQGAADLGPGAYKLRWQVLAIDGHTTRGDVPFTLTPIVGASPR